MTCPRPPSQPLPFTGEAPLPQPPPGSPCARTRGPHLQPLDAIAHAGLERQGEEQRLAKLRPRPHRRAAGARGRTRRSRAEGSAPAACSRGERRRGLGRRSGLRPRRGPRTFYSNDDGGGSGPREAARAAGVPSRPLAPGFARSLAAIGAPARGRGRVHQPRPARPLLCASRAGTRTAGRKGRVHPAEGAERGGDSETERHCAEGEARTRTRRWGGTERGRRPRRSKDSEPQSWFISAEVVIMGGSGDLLSHCAWGYHCGNHRSPNGIAFAPPGNPGRWVPSLPPSHRLEDQGSGLCNGAVQPRARMSTSHVLLPRVLGCPLRCRTIRFSV